MPPQLILSRQALDYVFPLPFMLAWLWFLLDYTDTRRFRSLAIGSVLLGCGFYSYIASWVMMPIYLAMSWIPIWLVGGARIRAVVVSVAAFAAPILVVVPWLYFHPAMLRETFDRYQMQDQEQVSMLQEPRHAFRRDKVAANLATYWSFFEPGYLFLTGGPSLTASTGRVGVFLLPFAVLLPLGTYSMLLKPDPHGIRAIILLGIVTAPVAATLKGQPGMIQRVLFMLPYAAIVAAEGWAWLQQSPTRCLRWAAVILLAAMPLQFAAFYRDFLTHYALRSAFYYDPVAVRDVASYLIADTRAPLIYLAADLHYIGAKWRFYTTRDGREDLIARTRYVRNDGLGIGPGNAGSLLAVHMKTRELADLQAGGAWKLETVISDVDHRETVAILRKLR